MKVKLKKAMGKMKAGESFYARNQEQADMLVKEGFAAHEKDDDAETEKELVLTNPEPGTWRTEYREKKASSEADTAIAKPDAKTGETETTLIDAGSTGTTATDLIAKINAADSKEAAKALVSKDEDRKTVLDAFKKKLESFK